MVAPSAGSSLGEDVYWQLRSRPGRAAADQPLAEIEIAERLNVSRTPVRESMQRLAADGLVISRRRVAVYEHFKQEIEESIEVRLALEGYAARLASQRSPTRQAGGQRAPARRQARRRAARADRAGREQRGLPQPADRHRPGAAGRRAC